MKRGKFSKRKVVQSKHFETRKKERKVSDKVVSRIIKKIKKEKLRFEEKTMLIIGKETLKEFGEDIANNTLVIIVKGRLFITTFFVDDLYKYLKSHKEKINAVIL